MLRFIPMSMLCALAFALLPTSGQAITRGNISYKSCSPSEVKEIDTALAWLKSHISQIDARMGKNNLANWPGRSRDKFIKKLDKILIFACIDHQTRCRREQDEAAAAGFSAVMGEL